jgi:uncharacterized protein YutD
MSMGRQKSVGNHKQSYCKARVTLRILEILNKYEYISEMTEVCWE